MPTNACSKPSTNNYVADLGEGPARTSYLQNRKAKRAGQREHCQKFVAALPRKALAVVSRPVPLPSSPVAPADYHFRYLLLIGEKERLGRRRTSLFDRKKMEKKKASRKEGLWREVRVSAIHS